MLTLAHPEKLNSKATTAINRILLPPFKFLNSKLPKIDRCSANACINGGFCAAKRRKSRPVEAHWAGTYLMHWLGAFLNLAL
jgi:hypothetical protein